MCGFWDGMVTTGILSGAALIVLVVLGEGLVLVVLDTFGFTCLAIWLSFLDDPGELEFACLHVILRAFSDFTGLSLLFVALDLLFVVLLPLLFTGKVCGVLELGLVVPFFVSLALLLDPARAL